jgi:hypothetical protein
MWPFDKELEAVLSKTKTVRIHGVKFVIKKIDPSNFLDGSKVMLQVFDTYQVDKSKPPTQDQAKAVEKMREHYRDTFMAGVVEPMLSRKQDTPKAIFVDHLFTEWDLAHSLYAAIMEHTYGKKNLIQDTSPEAASLT